MPTPLAVTVDDTAAASSSYHAASDQSAGAERGRMRRVASAPAFKHASAYQAPSATAAVAQAQADAAAEASSSTPAAGTSSPSSKKTTKLSKKLFSWRSAASSSRTAAASSATCSSCNGGRCNCLEVYVVSRPFTEFGGDLIKKLPAEAKDGMVDLGLCHYMTVFKTPDGQLVQFDFGPMGGDVQKAHGPVATFLRRAHAAALAQANQAQGQPQLAVAGHGDSFSSRGMVHSPSAPVLPLASLDLSGEAGEAATAAFTGQPHRQPRPKGVAGEIRERQLDGIPSASMYMGRTQLSLADIRRYNSLQGNMRYTLHDNDCRHYVNSLVQYATGVERSTQHLKRHYFHTRNADKWLWYGWFVSATQFVTDVGNWSNVQAGAAVTLLAVTGRSTLAQLKTLALPIVPAITRSMPSLIPSAGAAATGGSVAGGLATTLKLPAALLLKRPLAGSAVAAAGGAGAAAAAIRTVPAGADSAATAAAAATANSSGSSRGRGFGMWARPLRQWREGIGQGFRGVVLTVRRLATGQQALVVEQLAPTSAAVQGAAAGAGAPHTGSTIRRGWWGRNTGTQQLAAAQVGTATAVMALPSPAVGAAAPNSRWGRAQVSRVNDRVDDPAYYDVSSNRNSRADVRGPGFVGGFGHHVGRHVLWLGSTAAKATGALALVASKQVSYFVSKNSHGQVASAAPFGVSVGIAHSCAGSLLSQTPGQQQQQQSRSLMGQRSMSAPSLAVVAAAAPDGGGPAGQDWSGLSSSPAGAGAAVQIPATDRPEGYVSDDLYGSSCPGSVTCSSVGGRSSGVGRQVLNLPAPRISWGRRASHAVIVGQ